MNLERGGGTRHLSLELGKERKSLHLGFDEETKGKLEKEQVFWGNSLDEMG